MGDREVGHYIGDSLEKSTKTAGWQRSGEPREQEQLKRIVGAEGGGMGEVARGGSINVYSSQPPVTTLCTGVYVPSP